MGFYIITIETFTLAPTSNEPSRQQYLPRGMITLENVNVYRKQLVDMCRHDMRFNGCAKVDEIIDHGAEPFLQKITLSPEFVITN